VWGKVESAGIEPSYSVRRILILRVHESFVGMYESVSMSLPRLLKSFLPILPRFILEMVVGAVLLVAGYFVFFYILPQGDETPFLIYAAKIIIALFFMALQIPVLPLIFALGSIVIDHQHTGIILLLVYNGFLFALFCEIVRYFSKRKRSAKISAKLQSLDCTQASQSNDCGSVNQHTHEHT